MCYPFQGCCLGEKEVNAVYLLVSELALSKSELQDNREYILCWIEQGLGNL